jgi:hypothetical protein
MDSCIKFTLERYERLFIRIGVGAGFCFGETRHWRQRQVERGGFSALLAGPTLYRQSRRVILISMSEKWFAAGYQAMMARLAHPNI